jgi:hypothetical protein
MLRQKFFVSLPAAVLPMVAAMMLTACDSESAVKDRKMIVIAHHYPTYAPCGTVLDAALILETPFSDPVSYQPDEEVSCATFGRNEADNNISRSCYERDFGSETNDTCVIGVNYTDYADDLVDIVTQKVESTSKE